MFMIYHRNLLVIKILFENTSKKNIFGVYRPSAYLPGAGSFFTTLRLDIFKKEIEPGDSVVLTGILESPAGFGEYLKVGCVISVRSGLDEQARAMVMEILGYTDEV
jgi:hypothetical protein